ncbi:MAG: hypothetical protein KGJ79_17895 [Alphaproteobacteria bacterium]|nr:hypothetical protein [Alphaproteobacteria bacterium]MDE2113013.1 hypothetical protein [Alphaproteobacteria bacterium]
MAEQHAVQSFEVMRLEALPTSSYSAFIEAVFIALLPDGIDGFPARETAAMRMAEAITRTVPIPLCRQYDNKTY